MHRNFSVKHQMLRTASTLFSGVVVMTREMGLWMIWGGRKWSRHTLNYYHVQ